MKTLTLDQLAQSEFALNPSASLQVTGGEVGPLAIAKWLKKLWDKRDVIISPLRDHAIVEGATYLFTVEIVSSPIDCSGDSAPDIMTGCRF